jgi:hypothetical protein
MKCIVNPSRSWSWKGCWGKLAHPRRQNERAGPDPARAGKTI